MDQILIFSNNEALVKTWSTALMPDYAVDTIDDIYNTHNAAAIIIDAKKIDDDQNILSILNRKKPHYLVTGNDWSEQKQINALIHGASGYCGQSAPTKLLRLATECILKGDIWIQRHLVPKVIGALIQMKSNKEEEVKKSNDASELLKTLSQRELEVARMIKTGESNKVIAATLHISERTVKAHLTSIFKKLNVSDRLHLALYIKEFG